MHLIICVFLAALMALVKPCVFVNLQSSQKSIPLVVLLTGEIVKVDTPKSRGETQMFTLAGLDGLGNRTAIHFASDAVNLVEECVPSS